MTDFEFRTVSTKGTKTRRLPETPVDIPGIGLVEARHVGRDVLVFMLSEIDGLTIPRALATLKEGDPAYCLGHDSRGRRVEIVHTPRRNKSQNPSL